MSADLALPAALFEGYPGSFLADASFLTKRSALYSEARAWPRGPSFDARRVCPYPIYTHGTTEFYYEAPGKDFKNKGRDLDMFAYASVGGAQSYKNLSFKDIDSAYAEADIELIRLLGAIFVRAAVLLDHQLDQNGRYRLKLPASILTELGRHGTIVGYSPIEFVHMLELIAWNEDMRYNTAPKLAGRSRTAGGRPNNLFSTATVIATMISPSRKNIAYLTSKLGTGYGYGPIPKGLLLEAFPALTPP